MGKLSYSERLEQILNTRTDAASWEGDKSCSAGHDTDGSTGYEIFENGFELAVEAGGRPVTYAQVQDTVFFLIGTEDEACARAEAWPEDEDEDDYEG